MNDIEKVIELMKNELNCIFRNIDGCDRMCQNCDLVKTDDELLFAFNTAISALEKQIKSNDDYKKLKQRIEDTIRHYEEQLEEINELGPSQQLIGMRNGYEQVIEDLKTDIELGEFRV